MMNQIVQNPNLTYVCFIIIISKIVLAYDETTTYKFNTEIENLIIRRRRMNIIPRTIIRVE